MSAVATACSRISESALCRHLPTFAMSACGRSRDDVVRLLKDNRIFGLEAMARGHTVAADAAIGLTVLVARGLASRIDRAHVPRVAAAPRSRCCQGRSLAPRSQCHQSAKLLVALGVIPTARTSPEDLEDRMPAVTPGLIGLR